MNKKKYAAPTMEFEAMETQDSIAVCADVGMSQIKWVDRIGGNVFQDRNDDDKFQISELVTNWGGYGSIVISVPDEDEIASLSKYPKVIENVFVSREYLGNMGLAGGGSISYTDSQKFYDGKDYWTVVKSTKTGLYYAYTENGSSSIKTTHHS